MTGTVQPLSSNTQIVDSTGRPLGYFIRWTQERQQDIKNSVPQTRKINTGTGLEGGGTLAEDLTLALSDTSVMPGTIGDATHIARITVDQQGRITAIEAIDLPVQEAPEDGRYYCRRNGAWVAVDVSPK